MTQADLIAKLRTEMRTDPYGKIWSDDDLAGYLNDAYLQIQNDGEFGWPANEPGNTVLQFQAGVREYALDSLFGRMELIQVGVSVVNPSRFKDVMLMNPLNVQAIIPSVYYLRGKNIGFDPVPTGVGSANIFYRKILPPMSKTVDMAFTDDFAPAMVKYAAYCAWGNVRSNGFVAIPSETKLTEYQRKLATLTNTYLMRDMSALNYGVQRNNHNANYPDRLYFNY